MNKPSIKRIGSIWCVYTRIVYSDFLGYFNLYIGAYHLDKAKALRLFRYNVNLIESITLQVKTAKYRPQIEKRPNTFRAYGHFNNIERNNSFDLKIEASDPYEQLAIDKLLHIMSIVQLRVFKLKEKA